MSGKEVDVCAGQRSGCLRWITTGVLSRARCCAIDRVVRWLWKSGDVGTLGNDGGCGFTLGAIVGISDEGGAVMAVMV
jgi:hypothetical protein